MEIIALKTKEQLDIFINAQRQKLLRVLEKSVRPLTPKELSLEIGVSASSVQHHLKKLKSLGLVYEDHTANVNGIIAKYYAAKRVTVRILGEDHEPLLKEREILLKNLVADVLNDTITVLFDPRKREQDGDVMTGIVHLAPERAKELQSLIREFIQSNETPCADTEPWEYAFIFHRTVKNDD